MRSRLLYAVASLVLMFAGATTATAHVNGLSLEKTVGDHKVDVGFDSKELAVGETRWVDFWLLNTEGTEPRQFDAVWVRISRGDEVLLAATLRPAEEGGAGMLYSFSEAGEHELKVQFLKDYQVLAETSFVLPVAGQTAGSPGADEKTLGVAVLAFAGGALMMALLFRSVVKKAGAI